MEKQILTRTELYEIFGRNQLEQLQRDIIAIRR